MVFNYFSILRWWLGGLGSAQQRTRSDQIRSDRIDGVQQAVASLEMVGFGGVGLQLPFSLPFPSTTFLGFVCRGERAGIAHWQKKLIQ